MLAVFADCVLDTAGQEEYSAVSSKCVWCGGGVLLVCQAVLGVKCVVVWRGVE